METLITFAIIYLGIGIIPIGIFGYLIRDSFWPINTREEALGIAIGTLLIWFLWPVPVLCWIRDWKKG